MRIPPPKPLSYVAEGGGIISAAQADPPLPTGPPPAGSVSS